MLYVAIDQHSKQITVCVRNAAGETVLRRQVSTRPEKIQAFFEKLTQQDSQFMAILEVCGFNDWFIDALRQWKCHEIVLIHPDRPSKRKTDRRDAQKLADLLWSIVSDCWLGKPFADCVEFIWCHRRNVKIVS